MSERARPRRCARYWDTRPAGGRRGEATAARRGFRQPWTVCQERVWRIRRRSAGWPPGVVGARPPPHGSRRRPSRITRSIAPPPPWPRCQFMNLGPETDSGPCSVCHLRGHADRLLRRGRATRSPTAPPARRRRAAGADRRSSFHARFSVFIQLGPQASAVLHVDHVAGFREPIEQGAGRSHSSSGTSPTR